MREVPPTQAAARAASADPNADVLTLGFAVTGPELAAVRRSGLAIDPETAIVSWVHNGAPDRFGGIWLSHGVLTASIVRADPATLALAVCLAPSGTRYVSTEVSLAEGRAVQDRVAGDIGHWRANGIAINSVSYDEISGRVDVGVLAPTPEALAVLQAAYGPLIRLVQQGPIMPA
jgi:hypothetical protein